MTLGIRQIRLAPGDPVSEAWREVHLPSGRLVAFTDLVVRPGQPDLAVQATPTWSSSTR